MDIVWEWEKKADDDLVTRVAQIADDPERGIGWAFEVQDEYGTVIRRGSTLWMPVKVQPRMVADLVEDLHRTGGLDR